jgi:tetratricopeptide (TPR) repeat protein
MAANLGLAYTLEGRVASGLALAVQAVEQAVAGGRPRTLVHTVVPLSEAYLLAGCLDEARQRAAQALDLARQYQQRGNQAWALWLLAESMARQASPEMGPAVGHFQQALALAEELGMRPLQAHCHRGLGTLYAATGQCEQARAELSTAVEMYQSMDMTFWLPQAEAAVAQVEGR